MEILGERGGISTAYTIINSLGKNDIVLSIIESGTYGSSTIILGVVLKFLKDEMDKLLLGIEFIENNLDENTIKIQAQAYLLKFYSSLGFKSISEEYLEDGIPHIDMLYKKIRK